MDCVRLEDWLVEYNIEKVDLMWVDVQGFEKIVFESMGNFLSDVDGIATEIGLQSLYNDSTMKSELDDVLNMNFHQLESKPEPQQTEADVIYVNKKHLL